MATASNRTVATVLQRWKKLGPFCRILGGRIPAGQLEPIEVRKADASPPSRRKNWRRPWRGLSDAQSARHARCALKSARRLGRLFRAEGTNYPAARVLLWSAGVDGLNRSPPARSTASRIWARIQKPLNVSWAGVAVFHLKSNALGLSSTARSCRSRRRIGLGSMLALPLAIEPRDRGALRGASHHSSPRPHGYSPPRGPRRFGSAEAHCGAPAGGIQTAQISTETTGHLGNVG
jgi:hypothetical protein